MNEQTQNSFLISFNEIKHFINLDGTEYICLNDLVKFFPGKRIEDWQRLKSTKEFLKIVDKYIVKNYAHAHVREHNKAIFTIMGKGKNQGTYAHRYAAIEFLTWLSPEFKLLVIKEWDTWKVGKIQISDEVITKKINNRLDKFIKTLDQTYIKRKEFDELEEDAINAVTKLAHMILDNRNDVKNILDQYEIRIQFLEKEVKTGNEDMQKVYIMYRENTDEYKIGRSHNPAARKKAFQTIDPDLKIIYTIRLKSTREASILERFLQEKFSHKKIHGEWFKLDDKDLAFIETLKDIIRDLN